MTWTNRHPNQASKAGVVLFRHSDRILGGDEARRLLAEGGRIESTHPDRVARALGLDPGAVGAWVE